MEVSARVRFVRAFLISWPRLLAVFLEALSSISDSGYEEKLLSC